MAFCNKRDEERPTRTYEDDHMHTSKVPALPLMQRPCPFRWFTRTNVVYESVVVWADHDYTPRLNLTTVAFLARHSFAI